MTLSPWIPLILAVPVLILGEVLVKRIGVLARFSIPAPVVGGLLVAGLMLVFNLACADGPEFGMRVDARWWTWLVSIEPEWRQGPSKDVHLPLLVAFFSCIGLNASWSLLKRGTAQVVIFLALAFIVAVMQNLVGVALAKVLGISPLLGIVCGSLTMTGGHGTAMGFASVLEESGLQGAAVLGMAAATFGLVAGGLLGGPVGTVLIQKHRLCSSFRAESDSSGSDEASTGIIANVRLLFGIPRKVFGHMVLILICIKGGAWLSFFMQQSGMKFPVYIGAMIVAVLVRNGTELVGGSWIETKTIDRIGAVALGIFLSVAMMSLNLAELAGTALPMLAILLVQALLMGLFAWAITFRVMGRDFDAAVMAGGHCGFGLGATPNAVANMKSLADRFGAAPRAFLVVPIVGSFLIDLLNALNITFWLNYLK